MTAQMTIRIPDDVRRFVTERATDLHQTSTAVVIAALKAEMQRYETERERAILRQVNGDPHPELAPQSATEVAEVWSDLEW